MFTRFTRKVKYAIAAIEKVKRRTRLLSDSSENPFHDDYPVEFWELETEDGQTISLEHFIGYTPRIGDVITIKYVFGFPVYLEDSVGRMANRLLVAGGMVMIGCALSGLIISLS